MKKCFKCKYEKKKSDFYSHKGMTDGLLGKCKECAKKDVKKNFWLKREKYRQYDVERNRNNFEYMCQHRYAQMKTTVEGRSHHKRTAEGKEICTFEAFRDWWERNLPKFKRLHHQWKQEGYPRRLAPSIDRVDNNKGYLVENLQWLTQSQNSKKYTK